MRCLYSGLWEVPTVTERTHQIAGWRKVDGRKPHGEQRNRGRLVAACVLLAISFLLLAPDPHDHGDAASLGGLLRLFLPGSSQAPDPSQSQDVPQSGASGSCAIHFWQQVAAAGILFALLLRFFLSSLFHIPSFVTVPSITHLESFHSRAPPAFSS